MDKRLVYDPNVDLSNYKFQESMNNYSLNNLSSNNLNQNIQPTQPAVQPMAQQLPQIQQMQQPYSPQMMNSQYVVPNSYNIEKMSSKKINTIQNSNIKKLCSMSTLRKVIIITFLYVLLSHNKTSLLLCNNIPYVCITNALSYNILKGIIMAIVLVIFWNLM
jgi:hypothetical protein